MPYGYPMYQAYPAAGMGYGGSMFSTWLTPLMGVFSLITPYLGVGGGRDSANAMSNTAMFLIMGSLIEAGRRFYYWVSERWRLREFCSMFRLK
jgi:hypothetical protein